MTSPQHRTLLMSAVGFVAALVLIIGLVTESGTSSGSQALTTEQTSTTSTTIEEVTAPDEGFTPVGVQDLDGEDLTSIEPCRMTKSMGGGDTGPEVICLQEALIVSGFLSGTPSGRYDNATAAAVIRLQEERDLFVDGLAGRETAVSLGIWPEEPTNVIRTPPPPPGAVDLLGFPLSSVASSGPDAPPLPPNSGTGRRLVFERSGQRVWAVDENETVLRSWLVSGSKYNNETPGTHKVYSRSEVSTAWNGKAYLYKMVRWLKTDIGAIGFHALPIRVSDKSVYQTEEELGIRLSGGCQRQANLDADFTWEFAQLNTVVVVL